jgi:hypothetical protein
MKAFGLAVLCLLAVGCAAPPPTPSPSPTPTTATKLFCGRLAYSDCILIETMIQYQLPFAAHATALVMDYTCQPNERCEVTFNAVVSILIPPDPAMDYAYWPPTYRVSGVSGPETLGPWMGPLPASLDTLLRSAGFVG